MANNIEIAVLSRLLLDGANNLKLSGIISGTGNLLKLGAATLTLSGINTYTGSTTITAGIVSVGAEANLGGPNSVILDGGTLQVTGTTMTAFGVHTPTFTVAKTVRLDIAAAANTFSVINVLNQTTGGLVKSGAGTLALNTANTYTGNTTVNAGVLLLNHATALPGGIGVAGGTSQLVFNGGVVGLGNGDFSRDLDNTGGLPTSAYFTAGASGGWAAYGADRVVNINGASALLTWANPVDGFNGGTLILGASTADKTVDLQNPIDLGFVDRTVQADNGSATIDGMLTGAITTGGGGLIKTGTGTLSLNNATQAYDALTAQAGTTNVNGTLGTAPGMAVVTVNNAGTTLKFGSVSQTLASLSIGAGSTVTFTSGLAAFGGGGGGKAPAFGGGSAVVPEPGTIGLLLVGALGMLNRRRRQP